MSISSSRAKLFFKNFFADGHHIPDVLDHSYYPSLNGLRAISIIMVAGFHMGLQRNSGCHYLFQGKLGVDIFFVISGFLITTLCLKERVKTGTIDLKKFYIRRFLRIMPVALLYLGFVAAFNHALNFNQSYFYLLAAALYLVNFSYFKQFSNSYAGQFWSLAVEEQFYLIFPFLLKKNFKVYLSLILFIVFLLPLVLVVQGQVAFLNKGPAYFLTHFLIKFQGIAVGSLLAVITFKGFVKPIAGGWLRAILSFAAFAAVIFLEYDDFFSLRAVGIDLVISTLVALIILLNITPGKDVFYKLLNNKLMNTIGILSYSIYIWHMLFVVENPVIPQVIRTFPWSILCMLVTGALSYYGFEKYFLKLRDRFRKIKTVNDRVA